MSFPLKEAKYHIVTYLCHGVYKIITEAPTSWTSYISVADNTRYASILMYILAALYVIQCQKLSGKWHAGRYKIEKILATA